ncbi:hypothetical protein PV328_004318 [Microctonus aethiopoides]|uniref:Uncharacterized protein n=1 Tax=Microctonus aethiopoides TaxID=144406 RepID=A0AA39KLH7_9HYME|nr:hypothetical protein PV328_004318 [Microctonus aethiopoides]
MSNPDSENEDSDIITELIKQIEELKPENHKLKKNIEALNKNEHEKKVIEEYKMEITNNEDPSPSQITDDEDNWISIIRNQNKKIKKTEKPTRK